MIANQRFPTVDPLSGFADDLNPSHFSIWISAVVHIPTF
jgi:hypothetical protein